MADSIEGDLLDIDATCRGRRRTDCAVSTLKKSTIGTTAIVAEPDVSA